MLRRHLIWSPRRAGTANKIPGVRNGLVDPMLDGAGPLQSSTELALLVHDRTGRTPGYRWSHDCKWRCYPAKKTAGGSERHVCACNHA